MRRASLIAGAGIFLVGLGALAFVRPWGLRLPRALVIIPGADRVGLRCVARADRVRDEPLHAAGVVELQFHGWA